MLQMLLMYSSRNCEACLFAELLNSANSGFEMAQMNFNIWFWIKIALGFQYEEGDGTSSGTTQERGSGFFCVKFSDFPCLHGLSMASSQSPKTSTSRYVIW